MAVKIDGSRANVVWLSNNHNNGKLTKDQGILYVVGTNYSGGDKKLGQRNDKDLSGLTPEEAFVDRYSSHQSNLFDDFVASLIIVYDKSSVVDVDDEIRKLIHDLYLKGELKFDALFPGYQQQGNTELLVGYDDTLHMDDVINVVKQYFKLGITFNTHKPVVLRTIQEPVVSETVQVLLDKGLALLAAYASFGKTITSLQIISKVLPTGGIVLFTTPIVDTLQSLIDNVGKYHFGDDRNTKITFLNQSDFSKTSVNDLINRKNNGEIIIVGLSVQDLRYQDDTSNPDEIRDKYLELSGNLDMWVCDERHFHYEGEFTSKKFSNIKATYTLDLTATPYEVMDKYDPSQIISRTLSWGMINRDITGLPKLNIEVINTAFHNVNAMSANLFTTEEGFSPQKLFATSRNNFVYKSELLKICELFYGSSLSKKKNPLSIINDTELSDVSKNCGMWLLPTGDDKHPSSVYIPLLASVLNNSQDHTYFVSSYDLENQCKNMSIGEYIDVLLKQYHRIVILTCRKFTTGTDIPSLGHIVMFDKMESISAFEQLLGRTIRLYNNKDEVKVYSLAPGYSIKTTLGKIAKKNEALGGGNSSELLESVGLSEYDLDDSCFKNIESTEILNIAQEWCKNQVKRCVLPSIQLANVISSFDKSQWVNVKLFSCSSKTNKQNMSDDNGSKNSISISSISPSKIKKVNVLERYIKETIQSVMLESTWVSYTTKCYDYKTVFKNKSLIDFFSKKTMDVILNTAENNAKFRDMLNNDFLNKKMAFELLSQYEAMDLVFNNSQQKQDEGIVYVNSKVVNTLMNDISDIETPSLCIVVNALNGYFPLELRKRYPKARIICAELIDLYKDYLSSLGFEVIDIMDIEQFKKDLIMSKQHIDVIIQNPPYQEVDGGYGRSAKGLYNKFVDLAIALEPLHLISVIPSRWMTGGKGLNEFRDKMLQDTRISFIRDFHNAKDFFPSVELKAGICYFRWDRDYNGDCKIIENYIDGSTTEMIRPLITPGLNFMVRYHEGLDILDKVNALNEPKIIKNMPMRDVFGIETSNKGDTTPSKNAITLYAQKTISTIDRSAIIKNHEYIDHHMVIAPEAIGEGNGRDDKIKPIYCGPNSCFSKTYIPLGVFNNEEECRNFMSYIDTKFFHFLLTMKKHTQHTTQGEYLLIPVQDWSKPWTDEELFKKYNLSDEDIDFITRMVQ